MAKSAPRISFTVESIDYGTIDVGESSAEKTYSIYNAASASFAHAINMSISFKDSTNSAEVGDEEWVWVSTASEAYDSIGSVGTGSEAYVGSVTSEAAGSAAVLTKVKVPAGAATAGRVAFLLHHRPEAREDFGVDIPVHRLTVCRVPADDLPAWLGG